MISKTHFEKIIREKYGWGKDGEYLSRETARLLPMPDGSLSPYRIYELIEKESRNSIEVGRYYQNFRMGFCIAY